jgi:hypothetical protein
MVTGTCWGQDANLEPLFGFWKFASEGLSSARYYVLNVYSPEETAVKGKSEGIEESGASREVWAYYNSDTEKYRLIDRVTDSDINIWEFDIDGTTATGVCYQETSGSITKYPAEGMRMGDRSPNHPPSVPSNPTPIEGAFNLPLTSVTVAWDCSDPDSNATIYYDVYFGTKENLYLQGKNKNITVKSATFTSLSPATTYSWKVIAIDEQQGEAEGPAWHFTTVESVSEAVEPEPDQGTDEPDNETCPASLLFEDDPDSIEVLRQFRDDKLMKTKAGRSLVKLYYKTAPAVLQTLKENPETRKIGKTVLKALMSVIKSIMK